MTGIRARGVKPAQIAVTLGSARGIYSQWCRFVVSAQHPHQAAIGGFEPFAQAR